MKLPVPELESFCRQALQRCGVAEADARTATEVLVTTDTWGVFTHGTKALRLYARRLRGGGIRREGVPRLLAEGPAWATIDGDSALGMVTSTFAMRTAIHKARTAGLAYVGVRNSCHYGAAGYYAAMALPENMVGIALANDLPTVAVTGSAGAVLGSNPFAFAAPAGKERPILLDMATSTVAGGKVYAAAFLGQAIPDHWLVDSESQPCTNPDGFPTRAALTPSGGYKGYGLALMVEILSAVLTGAAMMSQVRSWMYSDPATPTGHGAGFLALNIEMFLPLEQYQERMEQLVREIRQSARAPGVDRILLPGEREWEHRDRALREGLELPADVMASLCAVAEELEMDRPGWLA